MSLSGILSRRGDYILLVEVSAISHQELCVLFYISVLDEGKDWRPAIGETLLGFRVGIQKLLKDVERTDYKK